MLLEGNLIIDFGNGNIGLGFLYIFFFQISFVVRNKSKGFPHTVFGHLLFGFP